MKKSISIIGSGPSALFLAAFLDLEKYDVTIYEKNKTAGRKFLVAGKGCPAEFLYVVPLK